MLKYIQSFMRKFLSLSIASILLASSFLAACSSGSKPADSSEKSTVAESTDAAKDEVKDEAKPAAAEGIVLKMLVPGYDSGYLKEELDNGIAGFEKANEGVKVEIVSVGWDELNSKIVSLYQAGDAPDIMLTGSRTLKQLASLGVAEDLSANITDEFKSKRVESVLATGQVDKKQYGIPMAFSSRALYYRSDLIEKAPTNWEELFETAKTVHASNPDVYGFAIPTDITSGTDELLNFIYQNDGALVNDKGEITFSTDANVATLEYLKKFNDEKLVPDVVSTARGDQAKLFANGNLAMFVSGPWEQETLDAAADKAPYKVAALPAGVKQAETLVTDSYVISSISKNKELAWKFVEFMGQPEYQRPVSEAFGWFPILKEEYNDERFKTEFMQAFAASIEYGISEPQVEDWDSFNKAFLTAVQKAVTGEMGAKEALDEAQAEIAQ